jgi:Na+-transporting NADH:ubiquinone oxidoreductase subunit C
MKRNAYTILYAFILGGICSLVPTAVGELTAPYREANAKAEEIRNILRVLEIPVSQNATSRQLVAQFEKSVRVSSKEGRTLYRSVDRLDSTRVGAVALAFSGPGIWGLIKGFLALDTGMTTIKRISFYQNEETPGLGGEIGTEWFQNKFIGKEIRDASGAAGFKIRRSGAQGPNEIDGISGATLTCGKVQTILNTLILHIDKEKRHDN